MHTSELLKHIYDINLSYLLLAQRLIVQDKASAMFRLGINEEMATTLAALTLPQMVKLAETNQLVCHFRFDSHQTITQLTQLVLVCFLALARRFRWRVRLYCWATASPGSSLS